MFKFKALWLLCQTDETHKGRKLGQVQGSSHNARLCKVQRLNSGKIKRKSDNAQVPKQNFSWLEKVKYVFGVACSDSNSSLQSGKYPETRKILETQNLKTDFYKTQSSCVIFLISTKGCAGLVYLLEYSQNTNDSRTLCFLEFCFQIWWFLQ